MTEEEKVRILNKYKKQNREVKCIICNGYIYADNKLLFKIVAVVLIAIICLIYGR